MLNWTQNEGAFEQLLSWLGTDRETGAQKYESIRRRLIYLFTCRGCYVPDELADETIDRVARAVGKLSFEYKGDPALYFYGVARNIHLEWIRRQRRLPTDPIDGSEALSRTNYQSDLDQERLSDCLEKCLAMLPNGKRQLLLRYYSLEKKGKIEDRKLLAAEAGLGLNAFRIQVFRLRQSVRSCIDSCMSSAEME
jgi:DNA-directed RNA polymerase specialized sigma24 family protein